MKQIFDLFDLNKDGTIDVEDLKQVRTIFHFFSRFPDFRRVFFSRNPNLRRRERET